MFWEMIWLKKCKQDWNKSEVTTPLILTNFTGREII